MDEPYELNPAPEGQPVQVIDLTGMSLEDIAALSDDQLQALPPEVRSDLQAIRGDAQDALRKEAEERQRRVAELGRHVVQTYEERVQQRRELELRWREDIRRYNGQYEPDVQAALASRVFGSRVFVPLARRVINIVYARLIDLLFPTDERNFVIKHTPVPMLMDAEALAAKLSPAQPIQLPDGTVLDPTATALAIGELRAEAESRATNMQREIDDQLQQSNYGSVARDVIREAMIIGTGVIKGPLVLNRSKKVWDITNGRLQLVEDQSPAVTAPSSWDFFPDMSARKIANSTSEIERHYLTAAELAKLAQQPGFDADAIRQALRKPPGHTRDEVRDELRDASGTRAVRSERYLVLEFHGPVDADLLRDLNVKLPDDPLIVYEAILFVLEDGTVIKAVINPMDTQERPYSVFCWEEDPACIFGFGLSYEVADMVEACNSSFRAAMDNLGLSVGPQVVVNDRVIEPANGRWAIEPNKIWRMKKADADVRAAFGFFQIDTRLTELLAVFDRSKALVDDIGGPVMAMQGQDAPSYLDTARGASIAWNASNIWMRRAVRNWDDDVTTPLIGRFVDWNMQYSPKQEIKGDVQVQARGVSGLLEAEGRNQKVLQFLQQASAVPMPYRRKINQLKTYATSLRLDPADVLPNDAEIEQIAQQVDNQGPPPNPELERIKLRQMELQDNQQQREHDMQVEVMRSQLRAAELAQNANLSIEEARNRYALGVYQVQAMAAEKAADRAHDAQKVNAELSVKARMGTGI